MRRDGSDDDEPASYGMRMRTATTMREMLAEHGIKLDAEPSRSPARSSTTATPVHVNRGEVRRVLIAGGVLEKDLRWLTLSAPSVARAREVFPPLGSAADVPGTLVHRLRAIEPLAIEPDPFEMVEIAPGPSPQDYDGYGDDNPGTGMD